MLSLEKLLMKPRQVLPANIASISGLQQSKIFDFRNECVELNKTYGIEMKLHRQNSLDNG